MEEFDLQPLDASQLTPSLLKGVHLGTKSPAGFPSLYCLPHSSLLDFHGLNVHGPEYTAHKSKNRSILVKIDNPFSDHSTSEIAEELVGTKVFTGWPFLWEGLVTAVSDSSFAYERPSLSPSATSPVISMQHNLRGTATWKSTTERIQWTYLNRRGVDIGPVNVLLHVRPLTGITVMDNGAVVKEYGEENKVVECAVQTCSTTVPFKEDSRYVERGPSSLKELYPEGTDVFFLGSHAYGSLARVRAVNDVNLSILREVSLSSH